LVNVNINSVDVERNAVTLGANFNVLLLPYKLPIVLILTVSASVKDSIKYKFPPVKSMGPEMGKSESNEQLVTLSSNLNPFSIEAKPIITLSVAPVGKVMNPCRDAVVFDPTESASNLLYESIHNNNRYENCMNSSP
jgi:hypothetical protein